jgi:hypothetical protein
MITKPEKGGLGAKTSMITKAEKGGERKIYFFFNFLKKYKY